MTDKELKRLSRVELIDIIYEMQKQSEEKDAQMQKMQTALDDRTLRIANAGSIAEAAFSINGIFEAAQAAADQYLASIKAATADMEQTLAEAEEKRQKILSDAEEQAADLVRKAEEQAASMNTEAEKQCAEKWTEFERRANNLIAAHRELQNLMAEGSGA